MSIIVFQHSPGVGPGRLGATFRDHGFKLDLRRLDTLGAQGIPPDFDNVHGVISLGGEQNVGEKHDWMDPELAFLREAHARQLPVIGICLGHQMVAAALGGQVGPLEGGKTEWGFTKVSINPTGQIEPMLAGLAWDSMQFQAHGQEVKQLPADATLLASSAACNVQAFRAGLRTFGFQYHFECDRAMVDEYIAASVESIRKAGLTGPDIQAQAGRHYPMFARLADRLCVNLAAYLFPLARKMSA
jgi:GMP synthase-like glutamine amidotransferase